MTQHEPLLPRRKLQKMPSTTKLPAQWLIVIGAFSHDHRGFVEGAKVLTHLQTHLCHIEVLRVQKNAAGNQVFEIIHKQ